MHRQWRRVSVTVKENECGSWSVHSQNEWCRKKEQLLTRALSSERAVALQLSYVSEKWTYGTENIGCKAFG